MKNETAKNILVVEDEKDFAELIACMLREEGFGVRIAQNGEEALKAVEEDAPDLITLDLQMPKKTGLMFFRQMRSKPAHWNIPVIVISGLSKGNREAETIIHSFLETGNVPKPEAYLEKPFEKRQLIELVNQVAMG